jgi:hypothetical protein
MECYMSQIFQSRFYYFNIFCSLINFAFLRQVEPSLLMKLFWKIEISYLQSQVSVFKKSFNLIKKIFCLNFFFPLNSLRELCQNFFCWNNFEFVSFSFLLSFVVFRFISYNLLDFGKRTEHRKPDYRNYSFYDLAV